MTHLTVFRSCGYTEANFQKLSCTRNQTSTSLSISGVRFPQGGYREEREMKKGYTVWTLHGLGFHASLQGVFATQESNTHLLCLLLWQAGSLPLATPARPLFLLYEHRYFSPQPLTPECSTIWIPRCFTIGSFLKTLEGSASFVSSFSASLNYSCFLPSALRLLPDFWGCPKKSKPVICAYFPHSLHMYLPFRHQGLS